MIRVLVNIKCKSPHQRTRVCGKTRRGCVLCRSRVDRANEFDRENINRPGTSEVCSTAKTDLALDSRNWAFFSRVCLSFLHGSHYIMVGVGHLLFLALYFLRGVFSLSSTTNYVSLEAVAAQQELPVGTTPAEEDAAAQEPSELRQLIQLEYPLEQTPIETPIPSGEGAGENSDNPQARNWGLFAHRVISQAEGHWVTDLPRPNGTDGAPEHEREGSLERARALRHASRLTRSSSDEMTSSSDLELIAIVTKLLATNPTVLQQALLAQLLVHLHARQQHPHQPPQEHAQPASTGESTPSSSATHEPAGPPAGPLRPNSSFTRLPLVEYDYETVGKGIHRPEPVYVADVGLNKKHFVLSNHHADDGFPWDKKHFVLSNHYADSLESVLLPRGVVRDRVERIAVDIEKT